MVRIGNGTVINTPLGPANVTYRQVVTDTTTGASVYDRFITIGGKTDNGTAITDNFPSTSQAAAVPMNNTLLGLLLRDSYLSVIINQLKCTATNNDVTDRGDSIPY